jgi:hypothetical protein
LQGFAAARTIQSKFEGLGMEALLKSISTFVPFVAPYPIWVKGALAICVLSGAVFIIGLVVAAPNDKASSSADDTSTSAWLEIYGLDAFDNLSGSKVKIIADVNGNKYTYPSLAGVEWAEIGPNMAPQKFRLPILDEYQIRFEAIVQGKGQLDEKRYASVESHFIKKNTDGIKTYHLRVIKSATRAASIGADVRYSVSRQ